jgi:hypothetical protein
VIQTIIVGILVLVAVVYLSRLIYRSFTSTTCEAGCAKCAVTDINAMVESFEKKKA